MNPTISDELRELASFLRFVDKEYLVDLIWEISIFLEHSEIKYQEDLERIIEKLRKSNMRVKYLAKNSLNKKEE